MSWGEYIKHRPVEILTFYPPVVVNILKKAIEHLEHDGKSVVDFRGEHLIDFQPCRWPSQAWSRDGVLDLGCDQTIG